jgi:PAS domain S-box-containing protein
MPHVLLFAANSADKHIDMTLKAQSLRDAYPTLAPRMRLILLTLVAISVLFSAATFRAIREYSDSTHLVDQTHLVLEKTEQLLSTVKDAETGQRGYLLTGQKAYLTPFLAANERVYGQLEELRALSSKNSRQRQNVDRFAAVMGEKLAELSETVRLNRDHGFPAALEVVLSGRGNALMTVLRDQGAGMRAESEVLLRSRRLAQSRNEWELFSAAGAAALAVILLAAFALRCLKGYRINRQVWESALLERNRYSALAELTEGLAAGKSRYHALVKATSQIVWTMAPDGTPTDAEDEWKVFTGQTGADVRSEALHPDDRPLAVAKWAEAMRTGAGYEIEKRVRGRNGEYCWMLARVIPVLDSEGSILEWIGACTDISGRKRSEGEIRNLHEGLERRVRERTAELEQATGTVAETRAKFQAVLDAASEVSIVATDTKGTITVFNTGAERMLQYSAEEVTGVLKLHMIHLESEWLDRSVVLTQQLGHPVQGFDVFSEPVRLGNFDQREWTYVRKDGSTLDVRVSVTALRNPDGSLQGFLSVATDITAAKFLEHELRVNNEKLAEQTRRAEEANLAKSNFLAAMSHEIRTPMNAILGMSDMLAESQLDAEQMQYVEVFRRAGANLLILINDILDLSKIEAGHLELENVDFDLEEVVDQAIELTGVKTRAKGIGLMSHLSPGLATALAGDPTRLRQVLINLLGNAVKFTEAGEVLLTVQNHQSGKPGEVEFTISDTGIGIPPGQLENIFNSFTQADSSITRKYGGTGLGLEISRRLVEHMGGGLTGENRAGGGSTFRFNAQFEPRSQSSRKAPIEVTDFHGCRVLVIDDNATNRFIMGETLNVWGIESAEFGAPAEALASLCAAIDAKRPYSMVLVDSEMPGMDGFETTARIKQVAPDLPVVMFTSDARPGDVLRRREAGLSGYAVKPVKRGELLRLMCDAMQLRDGAEARTPGSASHKETAPAKALRILIAEDSADNRLLVEVYLKGSPHQLTFAEDGKVAVDRFAAETFDLILMDMQMPVMDGLTAARAIRAIERERQADATPIIALTANARRQDIELSANAGCNHHLSKPISKHNLLSAIEEYGQTTALGDAPGAESAESIGIEMPPGLEEIVPGYLASRRGELPEMMALLAASGFDRLAVLGHNIKGTGSSYGFPELTRMGAALEYSAKQMDPGALSIQLTELKNYLGRVQLVAPSDARASHGG